MSGFRRLLLRAGWAPVGVVLAHEIVTSMRGMHDASLDPVFHVLGGGAIAFLLSEAMRIWEDGFGRPTRPARFLILFCMTATVAHFWEFFEFASAGFHGYTQLHLRETMGDLFLGCAGGALFLLIAAMASPRSERQDESGPR